MFFWAYVFLAVGFTTASVYRLCLLLCLLGRRPTPVTGPVLPSLTLQLPLYNEKEVVERLLASIARLEYPRELLEIQILDDSTDETSDRVANLCRALGLGARHIRRDSRAGFKAGALALGMARSDSDLFAVLDADFVPRPDFLMRLVPYFTDPAVGVVQARWGYLNEQENLLTRIQATYLNAHFAIEHEARFRRGLFFHFNGTAGIWRRSAIESSGGWSAGTLTEDLDLSYRAHLKGWKFIYAPDVVVPSELPANLAAWKAQQYRWAKGMAQVARHLLPRILRSRARALQKADAAFHLLSGTAYAQTLGVLLLALHPQSRGLTWLWILNLILLVVYFAFGNWLSRGWRWGRGHEWAAFFLLGVALAANGARATFSGWLGRKSPFVRTPKRGFACGSA